jgi:hypothetical protein
VGAGLSSPVNNNRSTDQVAGKIAELTMKVQAIPPAMEDILARY